MAYTCDFSNFEGGNDHCAESRPISKFSFIGKRVYENGKYFGWIIHRDNYSMKVEYRGDNRYMKGLIREFQLIK